jgi:hypothetical protein
MTTAQKMPSIDRKARKARKEIQHKRRSGCGSVRAAVAGGDGPPAEAGG